MTQLLVEYGARCDVLDDSGNSAETILQSLVTRYGNGPTYQHLLQLLWDSQGEILRKYKILIHRVQVCVHVTTACRTGVIILAFFTRQPRSAT